MKWEGEVKKELEDILDQYFPKGDTRRGDALMLFAMAMSYTRKTIKAFGGCDKCYGKGYSTQILGSSEHVNFCGCDRGRKLEDLMTTHV